MPEPKRPPSPWLKSLGLWAAILLALVVVVNVIQGPSSSATGTVLAYSDFLTKVDEGGVKGIEFRGGEIQGKTQAD